MAKDKKEIVEKEVKVVDEVKVEEVKVEEKEDLFSHGQLVTLTNTLARFEDGTEIKIESPQHLNDMVNYNEKFRNR